MSQLILVTGSRHATPAMVEKVDDLVAWVVGREHALICGDAEGVDAAVRQACHRLGVMLCVYGGYKKIRGPHYPGEQPSTVNGGFLMRDRVMAEKCTRGIAIMCAPKTIGTWYTGIQVERSGKWMRWAVWHENAQMWTYYDRSVDMPG